MRIRALTKAIVNGQELVVDGPGEASATKYFFIVDSDHPTVTCGIYRPQHASILLPILLMSPAAQSPDDPMARWRKQERFNFSIEIASYNKSMEEMIKLDDPRDMLCDPNNPEGSSYSGHVTWTNGSTFIIYTFINSFDIMLYYATSFGHVLYASLLLGWSHLCHSSIRCFIKNHSYRSECIHYDDGC